MKWSFIVVALPLGLLGGCDPSPAEGGNSARDTSSKVASAAPPQAESPQLPRYDPSRLPGMARIENRGYVLSTHVWRPPNIPVCWENPTPQDERERAWVRDAVQRSWEANSPVRFFGWSRCAPTATGIRIVIKDEPDNGPHTQGLGTEINRVPEGMLLNFTFRRWGQSCAESETKREQCIRSIGVHEFGHALAFAHEQNRPDTPGECADPAQGPDGDVMLTPWDPQSVMNYCNPAYNNNGRLSAGDIASLRRIYRR